MYSGKMTDFFFSPIDNPTKRALWDFRKHQLLQKQPVKEHLLPNFLLLERTLN